MNIDFVTSYPWDLAIAGLTQGALYALIALGYTLVFGVLRLINFAHSEVFMVGMFAAYLSWTWLGLDVNTTVPPAGLMLLYMAWAFLVAAAGAGLTALAIERLAYRPLRRRNAPSLIFLITAIGASLAIQETVGILVDRQQRGMPVLIKPTEVFTIGGASVTNLQLAVLGIALVMMIGLDVFVNRSKTGRAIRAVSQDPQTALLMGVNRDRIIMLVFVIGGLMAGVAAVLYAVRVGTVRYDIGFQVGITAFAAAVLGGIGNLRGALVGGLLLGVVESFGAGLFGNPWATVVSFVVLVLVLLVRPTGLLGESLGRARA